VVVISMLYSVSLTMSRTASLTSSVACPSFPQEGTTLLLRLHPGKASRGQDISSDRGILFDAAVFKKSNK
jgi:hypothetical protein